MYRYGISLSYASYSTLKSYTVKQSKTIVFQEETFKEREKCHRVQRFIQNGRYRRVDCHPDLPETYKR